MDAERLLYRLNCGKSLRPTELKTLVEKLEHDLDNDEICLDDHYIILLVLRRAKAIEQRSLLERYLLLRDPMVGCLVLETLCRDWGFLSDYLERVINLALGVPWDSDDDMRLCAIELLGDFLESGRNDTNADYQAAMKKVVQLLLRTVEVETEPRLVREGAFASLVRAAEGAKLDAAELSRIDFFDKNTTQRINEAVQLIMSSGSNSASADPASSPASPLGVVSRLIGSPATR